MPSCQDLPRLNCAEPARPSVDLRISSIMRRVSLERERCDLSLSAASLLRGLSLSRCTVFIGGLLRPFEISLEEHEYTIKRNRIE
eukprot:scaffold13791_cov352-Alexandrium_tamarense.AAC.2